MSISDSEQYDLLDRLAEEFADRFRRGERPAIKDFTDRYPELADDIRALFPALVQVEQADGGRQEEEPTGDPRAATPPARQIGDYRILREIGRGGMGVVYEAEQISLGRRVALKVLPGQVSSDRVVQERFRREARAAARLHHTNIVPVYDVGQDGDVRFYAMQFIQGLGLDAVIIELRQLLDRARSSSRIKASVGGRSRLPRGEHSRRGIDTPTLTEGLEVSRVLQYLLTGRLNPSGQGSELVGAPISARASTLAGGLPTGIGTGRRAAASDPALTRAETGSAIARDATGPQRPHPPAPALSSSDSLSSGSAILPGGTQLSSVESGRRGFYRSLAQIGRQAAAGLAYAHARGIVHRDIKPSNLLLDTEGVVWIADFGLAKGDDEGLTHTGDILGTLRYIAPERFRGEGDARADIYALGLTLYELITLRPGFDCWDRLRLIERIKSAEPQRPRSVDARIPRDLETIVLKAIEKDPKARYQSAEAMGEDLGRFLADEPIRARQTSAAERYWRWARRNPVIAVLGAVLTAVLVLVTIGSLLAAGRFARLAEREGGSATAERSARLDADQARKTAEKARTAAQAETYRAMLSEVKALRAGHQLGWREEALANVARLAVMPTPRRDLVELRTEAVACIGEFEIMEVARIAGTGGQIWSTDFSPDSRTLATASAGGDLDFWDVPGREHSQRLVGIISAERTRGRSHQGRLRFLPDGSLAYARRNHGVGFLDASGRPSSRPPIERGTAHAWRLQIDRPGRLLAVGWSDGRIDIHDSATGHLQRSFKWSDPLVFALSPDGQWLALGGPEHSVQLLSTDGQTAPITLGHHGQWVYSLAFSPDGKTVASTARDHTVILWDVASRKERLSLRGHKSEVTAIEFSPDGAWIATTCDDYTTRIWDARDGQALGVLPGEYFSQSISFSPDGGYLVASSGQSVHLYRIRGRLEQRRLVGHHFGTLCLAFHPRLPRLASASDDHALIVWDTGVARPLRRWVGDVEQKGLAYNPEGSLLASSIGTDQGKIRFSIRLWNAEKGTAWKLLPGHQADVCALAFDPTGLRLASGDRGGTILLWDVGSGRILRREQEGTSPVTSVAFHDAGRHLLAGLEPGQVALFDLEGSAPPRRIALPDGCKRLVVDSRTNRAIIGDSRGAVIALSLPDLTVVHRFAQGHDGAIESLALRPDGRLLATGGSDRHVVLRDAATFVSLLTFPAWTGLVKDISFDASGRWLAFAGSDSDLCLWDIGMVRDELAAIGLAWDQAAPAAESTADLDSAGVRRRAQIPVIQPKSIDPEQELDRLSQAITSDPSNFAHWYAHGNFLARRGDWAASREDFRQVLELHPPATWLEDDTMIGLRAAVVYLEAGDREGYRRLASAMLGRFADSPIPIEDERTAKVNLLVPPPAEDLDRLTELADRAVRFGQGHDLVRIRYYHLVRVMAAYRSGDFSAAVRLIGQAENAVVGAGEFYVSMAEHRMGHIGKARSRLDGASKALRRMTGAKDWGGDWVDVRFSDIARREAEALILQTNPPSAPTASDR